MDNLRGTFGSSDVSGDSQDWDSHEDEDTARDLPPEAIGQDERRMQVRAYNHWASLLGDRTFPSIEDLEPQNLPDFGPNSVLLDFSGGIEDPAIQYLGAMLAEECGAEGHIAKLSDVPPRSLLSRITDHYMQILANQAPIGFEAEFVNQRGASIMYRGILLPFSSDDESIDFIYGVINWKEVADQLTADELLLEIDQALESSESTEEGEDEPHKHHSDPLTEWADSPASETGDEPVVDAPDDMYEDVLELGAQEQVAAEVQDLGESAADQDGADASDKVASLSGVLGGSPTDDDLPLPDFGQYGLDDPDDEDEEEGDGAGYSFASLSDYLETPAKKAVDLDAEQFDPSDYEIETAEEEPVVEETDELVDPMGGDYSAEADSVFGDAEPAEQSDGDEPSEAPLSQSANLTDPAPEPVTYAPATALDADVAEEPVAELDENAGLHDFLASARELAEAARISEDRSRTALYAAVGRAYDFSLVAKDAGEDYRELLEESGLTLQDRAPMTPVVKLVFGSDYDKTRLTEYAAVLNHAHRLKLERGALADFLADAKGGLKGVVAAERRIRREEAGKPVEPEHEIRLALAEKLRELEELTLEAISAKGPEFSLVMVRRDGHGGVSVLGEIDEDIPLIERAAKKLVG
ncbi:hypothetical protein IB285_12760 [Erythrobacter sp. KMU-140]|uniref:PAS domain-containing protein n=1 Tax=Erythrobacter rubeus TaxID=2760803 RepID=A0ABR8KXF2_9SPHN|nr:hypothetical protein [Erythrobacter rubeus]